MMRRRRSWVGPARARRGPQKRAQASAGEKKSAPLPGKKREQKQMRRRRQAKTPSPFSPRKTHKTLHERRTLLMSEATKDTASDAWSMAIEAIEKDRRQMALVSAARTRMPTRMQP